MLFLAKFFLITMNPPEVNLWDVYMKNEWHMQFFTHGHFLNNLFMFVFVLSHFMPLISFCVLWKHDFRDQEKERWHEMGKNMATAMLFTLTYTVLHLKLKNCMVYKVIITQREYAALRSCEGSYPDRGVPEMCHSEKLWQWYRLGMIPTVFRRSTIPQKQFFFFIILPFLI